MSETISNERTVHVEVTAEMIATGIRSSCGSCPTALGVRAAWPEAAHIAVGSVYIYVKENGATSEDDRVWKADPPDAVHRFRWNFDTGKPVQPIACDLDFRRVEVI